MKKASKDEARLAFYGREFQSLGAATEMALSCVPSKCTSEGGETEQKASPDDLSRLIKGVEVFEIAWAQAV